LMGLAGPGLIATIVVTALLADVLARTRKKLGMQGLRGNQMLIELRDRIRAQGTLPALPEGWGSVSVLRPAGGSSFGGGFLVSACDGKTLGGALVDGAGKGLDAGTRALLLSGAFGGLLGSVPQEEFLSACNAYLRRGEITEGFVTAVHLALDLTTGEYVVTSAGHPPAAHLDASSGTWRITQARGIVLGVVADLRLVPERGILRPGDALMLYTDGLVEAPGRDIDYGTDRLLGEADRLVASGFRAGAASLVQAMQSGAGGDDCALALIWRTWSAIPHLMWHGRQRIGGARVNMTRTSGKACVHGGARGGGRGGRAGWRSRHRRQIGPARPRAVAGRIGAHTISYHPARLFRSRPVMGRSLRAAASAAPRLYPPPAGLPLPTSGDAAYA